MSDSYDTQAANSALFDALRAMWRREDPVPAGMVDRMVAAVAVSDLTREFALLTLLEDAEARQVRASGGRQTLQFGGDDACVLLHVAENDAGSCRVDGWSDPPVLAARLAQETGELPAETGADGRFAFDGVAPGRSQVRMVVKHAEGLREVATPWFEV